MAKKGLLRGDKFNYNHSTLTSVAAKVASVLKEHPGVTKIVLGPISPKGGMHKVTVREDQGQIKILCGGSGVQTLWVIVRKLTAEELKTHLREHLNIPVK